MDILNYLKDNLNQQQFEAASHTDTSALILAGAGSGKTRVLTFKIAYLIFGQKIAPENILAVTFTNKAANEMKQRIMDISAKLQAQSQSELDFDDLIGGAFTPNQKISLNWVGTFHSIFLKILKFDIEKLEMKYTKNFGIYDEGESLSILKDVIKSLKVADKISEREIKGKISSLKNKGITYQKYLNILDRGEELIGTIYEKYQKALENANALDFDDLLLMSHILFNKCEDVLFKWRNKFKYILVDEAQDTNQLQFEIIRQLSGKDGNVSFIGDDYQSIYMRRGAVMDNFLNISKFWPDVKIFKLEVNYRSKPHIVDAGNSIIKNNTKQYDKNVVSHREGNDAIRSFCFGDETDEAFNIIDLIQKIKEEKGAKRGDFAILYRTNAQSQPFESVLIARGIPYKIFGGFKFFERKEIKDIIAYLKYIVNPRDNVALKRIINTPSRKIGATSIQALEEACIQNNLYLNDAIQSIDTLPVGIGPGTKTAIKEFNTIIKYFKASLETMGLAKIIEKLVNDIRYQDYLIKLEGKEGSKDKMENIGQLINMASKYEVKGTDGLRQFLEEISLIVDLESDEKNTDDLVKLMSVHASKGLEFPVVFITGLEENLFPTSKARMENDELEEERRLMYVAITRAKDVLFLSHTNCRQKRGQTYYSQPSRFIDELPSELVKNFDLSSVKVGSARPKNSDIGEGQVVRHPLFGEGVVRDVFADKAMVEFRHQSYGTRKVPLNMLKKI